MMEAIKLIGTVFGAGGTGAFLAYKLGNRKQDVTEFSSIVGEYRTLLIGFKKEIKELRTEVEELRLLLMDKHDEVAELKTELKIIYKDVSDKKL
tara:strand:- start:669 stop:950 length:282 start_codon:yes stop_codon:yes gene_type:complete